MLAYRENAKDYLIKEIHEVTANFHPRDYGKHKVITLAGIVNRLDQLAAECSECSTFFNTFEADIINKLESFHNMNQREYHLNLKAILSHLRSKHKLVTRGYYTELYMSIGIVTGFPLGLAMGNLGLGIAIGICLGLAAGVGLDANAKRKGNIIFTPGK